jgi:hypothetical protein
VTGDRGHWTVVREVISSTTTGADVMSALPGLVRRLLDEDAWREYTAPGVSGAVVHETFTSFLTSAAPRGLNGRRDQLVALCGRDEALKARVQRLLDADVPAARPVGRPDSASNDGATNIKANSAEYVVARLKRDRPDLAARVVAGEITANAAAKQAGIRKPRVVLTSPESIARALRKHLDADDIAHLIRLLLGEP